MTEAPPHTEALLGIDALHALAPDFALLPYADAAQRNCIVARAGEGGWCLVVPAPPSPDLLAWADARVGVPLDLRVARAGDIAAVLVRHGDGVRAMDGVDQRSGAPGESREVVEQLDLRRIQSESNPVVRLTNSTVYDAYQAGASDIHLESTAEGLRVKYRLDGVLSVVARVADVTVAEQAISRFKVLAELDIAERRTPQDGRIRVSINGRDVDLRVSVMPSIHGEDAVLRILDKHAMTDGTNRLTLDYLGFSDADMASVRRLAREPYGMLLVTGPTGSGKTTTLYALISEINDGREKIVTIEDPVEYQLADVLQIPVNDKKGLGFAHGLRSILRHDPDKIMVGEIRDGETAQVAVQAALTGHLVLTTVHANNVLDVLARMLHMGVAAHSFMSAVNGIVAQRLLRLNCTHCVVDDEPGAQAIADLGLAERSAAGFRLRRGRGCGECRGTGYRGRKAISEVLVVDDDIREMVIANAPARQLREAARSRGMRSLREAAVDLVKSGETTIEEINRVTFSA